jgi:prolyl 4-hydroxylase
MNLSILFLIILICTTLYIIYRRKKYPSPSPPQESYKVLEYPNLLTSEECDKIIQIAKENGLSQSYIVSDDKLNSYDSSFRKSDQTWIDPSYHPILHKLSKISENLTQLPIENQEMIQIVRYEKGGKFDAHYDACVKNETICKKMNRNGGQRRTTLIVYLNDVLMGGETEFVNLNLKVKPEKGKGVLFFSTDENERILEESKHRGNEVLDGEKWIATIWSHPRKYQ